MTRPVGVPIARKGKGQAETVALWLGTFELIKEETTQNGHVLSNDAIALATTQLVAMIDMNEPWIGRHVGRLTNQMSRGVDERPV